MGMGTDIHTIKDTLQIGIIGIMLELLCIIILLAAKL